MKIFFRKWMKWIILFLLIYEVSGALLPFVHTKKAGDDFKQNFHPETFCSDRPGVDRARVVESSLDALDCRIQMISQARERIVLSTFDIRDGQSCRDIFSSLAEAADRGVKVQILVDGLYGSLHMNGSPIFYAVGTHPNMEIKFYNTPNFLKPWTINGRMHDKYVIVDDQLLLLGGRNTFDYFLGEYNMRNLSYDRDVLIYNTSWQERDRIKDSVIFQADDYFNRMWQSRTCKTVFNQPSQSMKKKIPGAREELAQHYSRLAASKPELMISGKDYGPETISIHKATFIYNPTHILAKEPWVFYQLQYLMAHAEQRAYIHTPYAVFSGDMYEGIREVVEAVPDVTMLLNATSVGDNFMASSDYTRSRPKILETGITLYEYFGSHSSHGKSVLIDDHLSLIGSYNLDMRSTYVDTETMLVIDGEEFNKQLEACIQDLEDDARIIQKDGTYDPGSDVPVIEVTPKKQILFAITSRLFQLIRYLI